MGNKLGNTISEDPNASVTNNDLPEANVIEEPPVVKMVYNRDKGGGTNDDARNTISEGNSDHDNKLLSMIGDGDRKTCISSTTVVQSIYNRDKGDGTNIHAKNTLSNFRDSYVKNVSRLNDVKSMILPEQNVVYNERSESGSSVVDSVCTRDNGDGNIIHEKHMLSNDLMYDNEKITSRLHNMKSKSLPGENVDYNGKRGSCTTVVQNIYNTDKGDGTNIHAKNMLSNFRDSYVKNVSKLNDVNSMILPEQNVDYNERSESGSSMGDSVCTRDNGDGNIIHEKHILSNDLRYDNEKIISRLHNMKSKSLPGENVDSNGKRGSLNLHSSSILNQELQVEKCKSTVAVKNVNEVEMSVEDAHQAAAMILNDTHECTLPEEIVDQVVDSNIKHTNKVDEHVTGQVEENAAKYVPTHASLQQDTNDVDNNHAKYIPTEEALQQETSAVNIHSSSILNHNPGEAKCDNTATLKNVNEIEMSAEDAHQAVAIILKDKMSDEVIDQVDEYAAIYDSTDAILQQENKEVDDNMHLEPTAEEISEVSSSILNQELQKENCNIIDDNTHNEPTAEEISKVSSSILNQELQKENCSIIDDNTHNEPTAEEISKADVPVQNVNEIEMSAEDVHQAAAMILEDTHDCKTSDQVIDQGTVAVKIVNEVELSAEDVHQAAAMILNDTHECTLSEEVVDQVSDSNIKRKQVKWYEDVIGVDKNVAKYAQTDKTLKPEPKEVVSPYSSSILNQELKERRKRKKVDNNPAKCVSTDEALQQEASAVEDNPAKYISTDEALQQETSAVNLHSSSLLNQEMQEEKCDIDVNAGKRVLADKAFQQETSAVDVNAGKRVLADKAFQQETSAVNLHSSSLHNQEIQEEKYDTDASTVKIGKEAGISDEILEQVTVTNANKEIHEDDNIGNVTCESMTKVVSKLLTTADHYEGVHEVRTFQSVFDQANASIVKIGKEADISDEIVEQASATVNKEIHEDGTHEDVTSGSMTKDSAATMPSVCKGESPKLVIDEEKLQQLKETAVTAVKTMLDESSQILYSSDTVMDDEKIKENETSKVLSEEDTVTGDSKIHEGETSQLLSVEGTVTGDSKIHEGETSQLLSVGDTVMDDEKMNENETSKVLSEEGTDPIRKRRSTSSLETSRLSIEEGISASPSLPESRRRKTGKSPRKLLPMKMKSDNRYGECKVHIVDEFYYPPNKRKRVRPTLVRRGANSDAYENVHTRRKNDEDSSNSEWESDFSTSSSNDSDDEDFIP